MKIVEFGLGAVWLLGVGAGLASAAKGTNNPERKSREAPAKERKEDTGH